MHQSGPDHLIHMDTFLLHGVIDIHGGRGELPVLLCSFILLEPLIDIFFEMCCESLI